MIHISTILAVETLPTVVSLQDLVAVAQDQAVRRLKAVPQGQTAVVLQDKVAQDLAVAVLHKVEAQDLVVQDLAVEIRILREEPPKNSNL